MTPREESRTLKRLKIIAKINEVFGQNKIPYMVVGGFARDAHEGKITRHHKDIDILIPEEYKDLVLQLSPQFGYPEGKLEEFREYKLHGGSKYHIDILYFWKVNDGYLTQNNYHIPSSPLPRSFFKSEAKTLNFCDTQFMFLVAPMLLIEYFEKYRDP